MGRTLAPPDPPTGHIDSVRRRPTPALRPYVAWYSGYRFVDVAPGTHRGLPSPYLTFILTLDDPLIMAAHPDPRQPGGVYDTLLGGLHSRPALVAHPGRQSGIQLALEPLGARALLGVPAGELGSLDLPATDVLGQLALELQERIRLAPTWAARFALLDALLLRRVEIAPRAPAREMVAAWHQLTLARGAMSVADLARAVGWSSRHLASRFGDEIGLSPRAAARVIRFDHARRALHRAVVGPTAWTLAELAATHGYYDQAHFAREFHELAGCAPSRWLAEEFRNIQAFAATDASEW